MHRPIPLIILGGSDPRPTTLPPGGEGKHPLSGCKGIDVRIGDRSLIEVLVERLRQSDGFGPIWIAGPASAYRNADVEAEIVDTDGSFGENIKRALEAVSASIGDGPLAFITCDVLPDPEGLAELLEDYRRSAPTTFWFPLVRAADAAALGPSAWKPRYSIVPEEGRPPVSILPGHLAVCQPKALRLEFLYRLFGLGYRSRNRPLRYRKTYMLRGVLGGLLLQDLLHVLGFRVPNLTWTVIRHGVPTANRLRKGEASLQEIEEAVRFIFVKRRHRRAHRDHRVRFPLTDQLWLARDIDTVEEARAAGATMASGATA
jgi:hypothetical protein